jgi:hypothetical protein
MKMASLKKYLETEYIVHCREIYNRQNQPTGRYAIHIGSPMCSELISLPVDTMQFTFALDSDNDGEKYIKRCRIELQEVYFRLKDMVTSGAISLYVEGNESGTVPVFYEKDGEILTDYCIEPGFPNVTNSGILMYNNTYFQDKLACAKAHIIDDMKSYTERHIDTRRGLINSLKELDVNYMKELSRQRLLSEFVENAE